MANKKFDNKRNDEDNRNRAAGLGERPYFTVEELAGSAGPLPDGMTVVELAREARRFGFRSRCERYIAQLEEERESEDS